MDDAKLATGFVAWWLDAFFCITIYYLLFKFTSIFYVLYTGLASTAKNIGQPVVLRMSMLMLGSNPNLWNANNILEYLRTWPRFGKAIQVSAITHRPSKLQQKSPTAFSLKSLAFWLSASTTHIAAALWYHVGRQSIAFGIALIDRPLQYFWALTNPIDPLGNRHLLPCLAASLRTYDLC